ncbi:hypothetical protein CPA40_07320 [Bifidobacterium callitrichos]|uniref:Uncharacterized protein n=1 Tax=Bifidobacterium callitrichos TaxID=762209 RepID=A0A2T3G9E5_9BIFI|nr:hypothetical protein CPA40_07320 [Bifidobacterium callitrichos]
MLAIARIIPWRFPLVGILCVCMRVQFRMGLLAMSKQVLVGGQLPRNGALLTTIMMMLRLVA